MHDYQPQMGCDIGNLTYVIMSSTPVNTGNDIDLTWTVFAHTFLLFLEISLPIFFLYHFPQIDIPIIDPLIFCDL